MKIFYWLRVKYKKLKSNFICIDSFCKICGRDVHDFIVDDYIWEKIDKCIDGHVLCYDCFCEKCQELGMLGVWKLEEID